MRNIWVMAIVAVAAGCGGVESQPWDKNHDGLVGQCEGLDRFFCGVTPGCQGQEVACLAVCRDDGKGGCGSPCASDFNCVPRPSQPPSCALVPLNSCASIPSCEVQTVTVCSAGGGSGGGGQTEHLGAPSTGCSTGCTSNQVCVNKVKPSCESTPVGSCTANPACELEAGPVCEIACLQGSPCPPCATPQPRCVTRSCESRSADQCTSAPGCTLETYACLAVCEDDGKGGCKNPCPSHCVATTKPAPQPLPPQPTK